MSIVLVTFPAAPKPNPDAMKLEQQFENSIRNRTLEILDRDPDVEPSRIIQMLSEEEIPDAPLHSHLGAKRTFIESLIASKAGSHPQD